MVDGLTLDGLSSGFPTSEIIEQLVELERIPIYRLEDQKSEYQSEQDAWRDVNTRVSNLESKLTQLKFSSTFNSRTATSSDEDVATATASTSALEGVYELNITTMAKAHRVASEAQASSTDPLGYAGSGDTSEFKITVNGEATTITVEGDYSLQDVVNAINDAEAGVQASIINNTLVLQSEETGTANSMVLEDVTGTLLQDLGVIDGTGAILNELQAAEDADLTINGIQVTSSSNSISDAVEGITFELKDEGQQVEITVARDTGKATSAVQDFVDQYNSLMDFINTKMEYDPETEKAEVLQGDSTLMRLQMRIRSLVMDTVDTTSDYDQLAMVGITIDDEGMMEFDSSKLVEALKEDPEAVENLFNAESDDEGFDGVATRLDSYLDLLIQTNTGVIPEKIDFYDELIEDIDERIEDYELRVEQARERYLQEFTAMETALSEMQSQGSWMMAQIIGMGGSTSLLGSMGG